MPAPAGNDKAIFDSIRAEDRLETLIGYLWQGDNMTQVGKRLFP